MIKQLHSSRKRVFWASVEKKCVACGSMEDLTIDHIIARVLGGTNAFGNLQVLCSSCNKSKALGESREHERRRKELFLLTCPLHPVLPASHALPTKAERKAEFRRLMNLDL